MNRKFALIGLFATAVLLTSYSFAANIEFNGAKPEIIFGSSYDNPHSTIKDYLNTYDISYSFKLVNSPEADNQIVSWFARGVTSVILEEFAGYASRNTFGWYNTSNTPEAGLIFAGTDSTGFSKSTNFGAAKTFGFYLDPNGDANQRMYSQSSLNSGNYQLAIFQINNSRDYILAWEDLATNGDNSGDRDYQDMIIKVNIAPVPEPATMFLFGTGLAGLAGLRLRRRS